uniref:Adipose-secreted signaling protein n=1 Tax=Leptobrachium leishanense TaxID=445787 RepID=A0A8C5PNH7_9ANUR
MATAKKSAKPKVAGVRFASGCHEEGTHNHVHFEEKLHDSVVMVSQLEDGNLLVKVGFLKILHRYEIVFALPAIQRLGKSVCAVPVPNPYLKVTSVTPLTDGRHYHPSSTDTHSSTEPLHTFAGRHYHPSSTDTHSSTEPLHTFAGRHYHPSSTDTHSSTEPLHTFAGHSVTCEYTAHKEGVLKEEMILGSETNDKVHVKVVVQARVLDRHHGTPMLLDGVKCIGAELEYDSEQSDWHGFD